MIRWIVVGSVFALGDVGAVILGLGTASSALTGALGGLLGETPALRPEPRA